MSRNYRVLCLSEANSPVTHMARAEGNEAIVAREEVATPAGKVGVPYLSGNAIRHRMVRAPGMRWLVDACGLAGRLSLPQLNFLFHGGSLTEGGGREDTRRIADWQRISPLGRLLGGSLPDQILAGSLQVGRGALVCRENRVAAEFLAGEAGRGAIPARLRPAEDFLTGYQYTRGDARKSGMVRPEATPEAAESNLMIFVGQAVVRGAAFLHDFTLPHAAEAELGALLWSLRLWAAEGGTVGGQAARGHGRLRLSLVAPDFDADAAVAAYVAHVTDHAAEFAAWLDAAFARPAKPDKAPKQEKAARGKASGPTALPADGAAGGPSLFDADDQRGAD